MFIASYMIKTFLYSRYGSYYVSMIDEMAETNPEQYNLLVENGLSVQAQDQYPLGTAADQRGEQTINKDAKTAGMSVMLMLY